MKPLIFAPSTESDKLREIRHLRHVTEDALKSAKIEFASSVFDDYDLVHFLLPDDIKKVADAKRSGIKIVMNALSCETEKKTAMLAYKSYKYVLKNKYIQILNLADLVLVPGEKSKTFLQQQGVISRIEVFPIPVDVSHIAKNLQQNKKLFLNYFGVESKTPYLLCVGDYNNKNEMKSLLEISELCPFARFYFLGANYHTILNSKFIKKTPSNVIFSDLLDEDIYFSALANAKALLILTPHELEAMNVLEAMACKTQIVAFSLGYGQTLLKHKSNAYLEGGITELVDTIHKLVNNKLKPTTENAYKFVAKFDLTKSGKRLKDLYNSVLKGE